MRWRRDRVYQAENIHALGIRVMLDCKLVQRRKGQSKRENNTHNCFESTDFLLLSYHASPSTTSPTDGLSRVFAVNDTFHDFAEKSNALSISNNGAIRVIVGRVEPDSFASKFKSPSQGPPRGRPRTLGRRLGVAAGGKREWIRNHFWMLRRRRMGALSRGRTSSIR
jgi:hypothetical protein